MAKEKFNIYAMITDRFLDELEKGIIPWNKPWFGTQSGAFNRVTKKPYSLLNQLMLKHDGEYASFKQWTDLGGKIKKGAKSEIVVFWKPLVKEEKGDDGETKKTTFCMLRYYRVFHISDVEDVEPLKTEDRPKVNIGNNDLNDTLNAYIDREGITYREIAGDKAYYAPGFDEVVLPLKEQFKAEAEYYSTKSHELVHSTLKESRCNREAENAGRSRFGSEDYSKEELVAEIGAAALLNRFGLETPESFKNSTAYIQSWIKALRDDKKWIVSAAGKAEKAMEYIIGNPAETPDDPEETKEPETVKEPETTQEKPEEKPEEPKPETKKTGEKKTAGKGKGKKTGKTKTVKTAETAEEKLTMEIRHNIIGGFRWIVDGYYNSLLDKVENVLPRNYAELKQDIYDEVTNNRFDQTGKRLGKMPKDKREALPEKEIRAMIAELCGTDEAVKEMAVALKW